MRWMMSGRFTPAAFTRIRIWPSAGCGRAIRTGFSASAGPFPPSTAMAVIISVMAKLRERRGRQGPPWTAGTCAPAACAVR